MSEVSRAPEQWLPVVDWEGCYEVSDYGRVRSVVRTVEYEGRWGLTRRTFPSRMLKPFVIWDGHARVALVKSGERQDLRVHVLVLTAFVCRRPEGLLGCHNDGDPGNNHVSNLRWDTHSGNGHDAVLHGNHHNAAKDSCPRDHALVEPNLTRCSVKIGHRACLACSRAYNALRPRHGGLGLRDPRFQAVADRYYEKIMGGLRAA